MAQRKALSLTVGVLAGLAVSMAIWAIPQLAHAGGVRLSIGIGIPAPVYVAPPPVVVHPAPIIVQPAPGIVYPPPGIVYPPPVVYTVPYDVYGRPLPPGLAKKYYGYHPAYGYKFYKHGKRGWQYRHNDD
jgi:hypothetical protein